MVEKILVVDDDLDAVRLVGLMLERHGYQIMVANSGQQALDMIKIDKPDLILLDLMMPEMDGITVARRLRSSPETQGIFIIVFSAKSQIDDKLESFEAGADDYLTKPIQPRELVAHVKAVLKRSSKQTLPAIEEKTRRGKSVALISAKGGVGVSTVAVNLGVTIRNLSQQKIVVADYRPGSGTIGLDLGIAQPGGLCKLLRMDPSMITLEAVENELYHHPSGLDLLLASAHPFDARLLADGNQSDAGNPAITIYNRLENLADYLILDLGSTLLPSVEEITKSCALKIVVLNTTLSAINQTRMLLKNFPSIAEKNPPIILVVEDSKFEGSIHPDRIDQELGQKVSFSLVYAPESVHKSQVAHQPVIFCDPSGELTQQYYRLAAMVTNILR